MYHFNVIQWLYLSNELHVWFGYLYALNLPCVFKNTSSVVLNDIGPLKNCKG